MAGVLFTVGLIDRMSNPAREAAKGVDALQKKLAEAKKQLSGFQSQARLAKDVGDFKGFLRYRDEARQAQERVYGLAKSVEGLGAITAPTTLAARFGPLTAGIALASGAALGFVATVTSLSLKLIDAANEEAAFNRQTRAAFDALSGSSEGGERTVAMLESLTKRLPIAKNELADWTKSLQEAGLQGGALRGGVTGLAGAKAVGGEEGVSTLLGTLRRVQEAVQTNSGLKLADKQLANLAKTGVNVVDISKRMGISVTELRAQLKAGSVDAGKFGTALLNAVNEKGRGPLRAMWGDLDIIKEKGREAEGELFRNVDLSPLIGALNDFLFLLNQGGPSGKTLERGVTGGVNGIVKAFATLTNRATVGILKIETAAIRLDTWLMPVEKTLGRILRVMTEIGKVGTLGLLAQIPVVGPLLSQAAGGAMGANAPPSPAAVNLRDQQKTALIAQADQINAGRISGGLKGEALSEAGFKLSDALADGIQSGIISHADAVALRAQVLGQAAVDGVKRGAQVHSPSRATMWVGAQIGTGLAVGMRRSHREIETAGDHLGTAAAFSIGRSRQFSRVGSSARESRSETARGGQARGGVHVGRAEVHIAAPQGVTDATQMTAHGLAIVLERFQLMSGA